MTHAALKSTVTTALMGVAGVLAWMFWLGDPCLGTAIANHWAVKNPPSVAPLPHAGSTDTIVVENPYGFMTCDHWPTAADQVLKFSVLAIVAFTIGWLAARRISHRPLLAAAAITASAMLTALSLQYWARWESVASLHSAEGLRLLWLELLASLALFLLAAGITTVGAWVAIRVTRGA
jgi:hypothetical protein